MLKVRSKILGPTTVLELSGGLDEHAEAVLGEALKSVRTGELTLDLGQVDYINSPGVRGWLVALDHKPADARLTLARCPVVFMDYRSIVPPIVAGAVIESLFVPYHCSACGEDEDVLLRAEGLNPEALPAAACRKCRKPLEIKASELYFDFLP